jgi:tetratricopeptide (TPR) repeat protein
MDTNTLKDSLPRNARVALEPTARGAQLRRRAIAVGGFGLLVLGFLLAVGAAKLVLLLFLLGAAISVFAVVRKGLRDRPTRSARSASDTAGERRTRSSRSVPARAAVVQGVGAAARRPLEGIRNRRRQASERAASGRKLEQAGRLNARGVELRREGSAAEAVQAHRTALELVRSVGDPGTEAMTLNNLALALSHVGDEEGAIQTFDEARTILQSIDDQHHEGQVLANLGLLHGRRGRHEQALYCLEEALAKLDRRSPAYGHVEEQLRRAS